MAKSDPVSRWDHEVPRAVSGSTGAMLEAGQPLQPKQSSRKLCVDSWAPGSREECGFPLVCRRTARGLLASDVQPENSE